MCGMDCSQGGAELLVEGEELLPHVLVWQEELVCFGSNV